MRVWKMNTLLHGCGYSRRKVVRLAEQAGQAGNSPRDEIVVNDP